jgi:hypothetical protein
MPTPHVQYCLVCHETRTKCFIATGKHVPVFFMFDTQALANFLHDNLPYPLLIERLRNDIAGYPDYADAEACNTLTVPTPGRAPTSTAPSHRAETARPFSQ